MKTESDGLSRKARALNDELNRVILGKEEMTRLVCAAFFARGHILLEGLPGLGKTVLAKALGHLTGLGHKRIQFTPDLMPADITGTHMIEDGPEGRRLRFIPGPIFAHFVLADEINRASPKTQAAMLEAMAESSVTHMGESRPIEAPFFVIATQNPIEMEGVNPLPEAQLDRFAVKFQVPSTSEEVLLEIVRGRKSGEVSLPPPILSRTEVLACQDAVDDVFLPEAVGILIARIVARTDPASLEKTGASDAGLVQYGSSPRGAIWLARLVRALAFLDGRTGASFDDVKLAVPHVLGHRIILGYAARLDGVTSSSIAARLHDACLLEVLDLKAPKEGHA